MLDSFTRPEPIRGGSVGRAISFCSDSYLYSASSFLGCSSALSDGSPLDSLLTNQTDPLPGGGDGGARRPDGAGARRRTLGHGSGDDRGARRPRVPRIESLLLDEHLRHLLLG